MKWFFYCYGCIRCHLIRMLLLLECSRICIFTIESSNSRRASGNSRYCITENWNDVCKKNPCHSSLESLWKLWNCNLIKWRSYASMFAIWPTNMFYSGRILKFQHWLGNSSGQQPSSTVNARTMPTLADNKQWKAQNFHIFKNEKDEAKENMVNLCSVNRMGSNGSSSRKPKIYKNSTRCNVITFTMYCDALNIANFQTCKLDHLIFRDSSFICS